MIEINGHHYKELRCKNDKCRKLFGHERIRVGRLVITCSRCGTLNEWAFDKLENIKLDKNSDIRTLFKIE